MTRSNRFDLVLQALAELAPEIENARAAEIIPSVPTLGDILGDFSSLPRESLFLGIAKDGLPILLDLNDPSPGPILVAGDAGTGKTTLLKVIAHAAARHHTTDALQFGVITAKPEEWEPEISLPNCAGIYPDYHNDAMDFLLGLSAWAHNNRGSRQAILLLIDSLECVNKLDFEAQQNLRWLLMRGPNRRVWPIVSLDAGRYSKSMEWLDAFRTRIFGSIRNVQSTRDLTRTDAAKLQEILADMPFALREGDNWLNFWIPALDAE